MPTFIIYKVAGKEHTRLQNTMKLLLIFVEKFCIVFNKLYALLLNRCLLLFSGFIFVCYIVKFYALGLFHEPQTNGLSLIKKYLQTYITINYYFVGHRVLST